MSLSLDSGASSHMTFDRDDFLVFNASNAGLDVLVASGDRL